MGWRINSVWPKFKLFWHLHEAAGPTGISPGNSASTGRPLAAMFVCGGKAYRWQPQTIQKPASAPIGSTALAAGGFVSAAGPSREVILQKLDAGLTAQRIYQDLCSDHGYACSY
jgi:hypothetical protein